MKQRRSLGGMVVGETSQGERDTLLTPAEVARILGVHQRTVTAWANQGKLPALRTLGGHRRFRRSHLNDAIAKANAEVEVTDPDRQENAPPTGSH
jgi:excisionase family DNA binding protein